jgi:hypothetical protein
MVKVAGQAVYDGRTVTLTGDGTAAPGDFVGINSGKVTTADDTTDTNIIGVVSDQTPSHSDGDTVEVHVTGVVVGNVASGVAAGVELGTSATEGEAASGSQDIDTFCAEGGEFKGASIDAGYAAVHLG